MPIWLWDVKAPICICYTISLNVAVRLSVLCTGYPLPPGRLLVLISVRGWVDPRAIMRLEGSGQLKIQWRHCESKSWSAKCHSSVQIIIIISINEQCLLTFFFAWQNGAIVYFKGTWIYHIVNAIGFLVFFRSRYLCVFPNSLKKRQSKLQYGSSVCIHRYHMLYNNMPLYEPNKMLWHVSYSH
jgi:hypothetical protein